MKSRTEYGGTVKQTRLRAIWAVLALFAVLAFPASVGAQDTASDAAHDPVPFTFFDGHAYGFDYTFGFDRSRFYRFASAGGAFRPWHQDRRYRGDLIDRVIAIDRIRAAIVVLDIFDNAPGTAVIVGP